MTPPSVVTGDWPKPTASPTTGISKPIVGDNTPVRTSPRSKRCRSACHPAWKSKRLSDFHLNHVFLQSDFFTTGRSSTWSHHWHRASAKHLRGNEPRLRNRPFSARHGSSRTTPGRTNSSRQSGCRKRLGNTPPNWKTKTPKSDRSPVSKSVHKLHHRTSNR